VALVAAAAVGYALLRAGGPALRDEDSAVRPVEVELEPLQPQAVQPDHQQVLAQCFKGQMAEQVEQEQDSVEETHLKGQQAVVLEEDYQRLRQLGL
jgi:TolA-binding protein